MNPSPLPTHQNADDLHCLAEIDRSLGDLDHSLAHLSDRSLGCLPRSYKRLADAVLRIMAERARFAS